MSAPDQKRFLARREEIITGKFHPTLSAQTRLSEELEQQSGIVIGLTPSNATAAKLSSRFRDVKRTYAAVCYPADALHVSLAVAKPERGIAAETDFGRLRDKHAAELERLERCLAVDMPYVRRIRTNFTLLTSDEIIIAANAINQQMWTIRRTVMSCVSETGLDATPSWGLHMVLAHYLGSLPPDADAAVNRALGNPLNSAAEFVGLFVGLATVHNQHFRLEKVAEFNFLP